jgi:hypothetical protein
MWLVAERRAEAKEKSKPEIAEKMERVEPGLP